MKDILKDFSAIIALIFSKKNILWQLLALAITYILVVSGFDWFYFTSVRNESLNSFFYPALFGGFLIPLFVPILIILLSKIKNFRSVSVYGIALFMSAVLGWIISSTYKAFTGRVQPDIHNVIIDSSRNFQFGFLRHGIFWGWPSSHTTVAFGMVFACLVLIPKDKKLVRLAIFFYALYVGIGVSLSIHWFSDFIAGAVLGTIIGTTVGNYYKNQKRLH